MRRIPKIQPSRRRDEMNVGSPNDALLEQVISRLSLEPGVSALSWKVVGNSAA
jgi:hypothetical protein